MNPALDRLNDLCLALPETEAAYTTTAAGYTVRGKYFARYFSSERGEDVVALAVRCVPGVNRTLVEQTPHRYYLPSGIARYGWVGLRLDVGEVDWPEVATLVLESYRLQAPRRLLAELIP